MKVVHRRGLGCLLALALCASTIGCTSRWTTKPLPAPSARPAAQVASQPPVGAASGAAQIPAAADVPARLGGPRAGQGGVSTECLAQIEAFAELQTGNRVLLGQAAFADSDQLVLARAPLRGRDARLLDGRAAAGQPVVFNLLRGGRGCAIRLRDVALNAPSDRSSSASASAESPSPSPGLPQSALLPACTCTVLSEQAR